MLGLRRKIQSINIITPHQLVNPMLPDLFLSVLLFTYCMHSSATATDTLHFNGFINDDKGDNLLSEGERFQLGFFTPNGSSDRKRYVGIWYYKSNRQTVVWVANPDNPISDASGNFGITEDGNLKVLDANGRSYWCTDINGSSPMLRKVKLLDSGDLMLTDERQLNQTEEVLWHSFANPTDTFLPGMKMSEEVVLTSWISYDDPAPGNFTFRQDQGGGNQFTIWRRSVRYWTSSLIGNVAGSGQMPAAISYLLSNFNLTPSQSNSLIYPQSSLYNDTRLIMTYTGQFQFLKLDSEKNWSLVWAEPRDKCSVYNACGIYGSCNSKYDSMCKCLPGFKPNSAESWNKGDFSGGCGRKSNLCSEDAKSNTFLNLKMMKVSYPDSQFHAKNELECKMECLNNCLCTAYSYEGDQGTVGDTVCWIWSGDLNNLQEEYDNGRSLNVRVAVTDIKSTGRNCGTCGTNLISYPLSTGAECGDPTYSNFYCNMSTSRISFETPGGNYQVISIRPETRKFFILTRDATDCMDQSALEKLFHFNQSSPFHLTGQCSNLPAGFYSTFPLRSGVEVEINWQPPPEPVCSSPVDCKDWPNSNCNTTKGRCICKPNYNWDPSDLSCKQDSYGIRREVKKLSAVKVALSTVVSVTILIILSSTMLYTYIWRRRTDKKQDWRGMARMNSGMNLYDSERHVKDLIESGRFKEDDIKITDIPYFYLGSILAATDTFSNANKLGQGGFGPVYKGKLPGGQEIAVKRLSSFSGQGLEEFKNEVVLIAKLQHRNLVRLLGFCDEGEEKMLVYEYMPNKSLDSFIFDSKLSVILDWDMRFKIILGIARGLLYLHQDSRLRIIHRDLKTSNILLDEEMNPKISDFGLARICGGKETSANTSRVVGTYGYMSPEYALDGFFSIKSDVFSFGVVILEIISGKRNTGFYQSEHSLSLLGYAWHLWKEEKASEFMDHCLLKTCIANEYLKCVTIGLLCVQEDPTDRPTMSDVVFVLGSESSNLPTPKQPAFVVRRCPSSRASSSSKLETFSHNELTVTIEDGR